MIVNEELGYVLETIRFKTSIYRDKKKRNLSFNDDDYYSNILNEYITDLQQENARLKDKLTEIKNKLIFIKNRAKQGMSQENINKCAIKLINSYLKEN